ncbi:MAG: rod-binding protein [Devosia sp.]
MTQIALPKVDARSPGYDKLHKQATELEGVFLNTLMKEMFASIETSEESFGGGFAEQTWRGMQAEQFANAVAERGGIGLADAMMGDLLSLQEATPATAARIGV